MPISAEDRGPKKSSRLNPAPYLRVLQLIDAKYPKVGADFVRFSPMPSSGSPKRISLFPRVVALFLLRLVFEYGHVLID